MKRQVQVNKADYTVLVFIPDPASTDGSGKTGLVAADLTVSGTRVETDNDVVVTDYTSSLNNLSALTDAHTDWGLKEVSSTLAPGLYRLDIADAIFASGAWAAVVYVMITTSAAAASPMEFVLVTHDPDDLGTKQSGDSYARIGAPVGASISVDLAAVQSDTNDIQTRLPAALVGGKMDSDVGNITAAGDVADAVWNAATVTYGAAGSYGLLVETNLDAAVSNLATQASVNTIDDFLDTEIAAIKAKTDSLTFTVAGQVDANIQSVNDVTVTGNGGVGTEWGP